ncbi:MAG: UDP-N-acetylmuramate--L-alanine ligase [Planctomycetes bacterium]|nr:UDP-N-acetylmuramate--L-alanine ligase [Planctomycetota bacterium]MBI3844420.1 UDP-N-acetylmuramate--L-alanine ligase [Planctomycetota bacterium]
MAKKGIHLVGVGGIGMSGLAGLLMTRGARVSGSDLHGGALVDSMRRRGVRIHLGHAASNVAPDVGLVIHSAAIAGDNPEIREAKRRGIRTASYTEALGWMMRLRDGIAISGTHGKTTTTAMIGHILVQAGEDPIVVVGGLASTLGGNFRMGRGTPMVVEACEYRRSFLALRPRIAVVTNVEEDHLDYYRDLDDIFSAFREFLDLLPAEGATILNVRLRDRFDLSARRTIFFGAGDSIDADVRAGEARWDGSRLRFRMTHAGVDLGEAVLRLPGEHIAWNAAAAVAAVIAHGMDGRAAVASLASFDGVDRRFQVKGRPRGVTVIDDYAHHPTAIRAVLDAARTCFPGRRLIAVFQPHQYSRTRSFLDAFARSFGAAKQVVVPDIYAARDTDDDRRSVSSRDLVARIRAEGVAAEYAASFTDALAYLEANLRAGDVCLTVGAGDVTLLSDELVRRLEKTCEAV